MTDTTADKPEALRLADALEREAETNIVKYSTAHKAAKELRRQRARLVEAGSESESLKARIARIGMDIDRALAGKVVEQSPVASRLKMIAELAARAKEGKA